MKYLITFLIVFLSHQFIFAQIEERPLTNNPVLVNRTWEAEMAKEARIKAANAPKATERGGSNGNFEDTLYVLSGQKYAFTVDTFGLDADSITLPKSGLKYGTIAKDGEQLVFQSFPNVSLGQDTLQLLLCNAAKKTCDTLCYFIVVKRSGKTYTNKIEYIKALTDKTFCVNLTKLTGAVATADLVDVDRLTRAREERKVIGSNDSCIYYLASRLGGYDNVYYVVKDINEVSDTFLIPVKVLQDTLPATESLLFMDDFSYNDGYPNPKKWLDDRVYINNGMAVNPPSVGCATFDGVNYTGLPYLFGYGVSDVLTSAFLDFSTTTASTLYLSYYLQPKGLGYPPSVADSFFLEFKDKSDRWNKVLAASVAGVGGTASDTSKAFQFYSFPISSQYLYKGFQFRFGAYGGRTGVNDIWNLDYVRISEDNPAYIDAAKKVKALPFKDLAFTTNPPKLLKNYTAMPLLQLIGFEDKEINKDINYSLFSHFGNVENITNGNILVKDKTSNTTLLDGYNFFTQFNIPPALSSETFPMLTNQSDILLKNLKPLASTANELNLVTEYTFKLTSEQNKNYDAVSYNDTTRVTTDCSNYYAYDDGTAESVCSAIGADTQLAVRFTTNTPTILNGIAIHFPYFNKDNSTQKFHLRVFIDKLKEKPDFEKIYVSPKYAAPNGGGVLNGYTYYELTDAAGKPVDLQLPKGTFYVGWQQISSQPEPVFVGFDKNNPEARQHIFANTTGIWKPVSVTTKGAVMIRPVVNTKGVVNVKENDKKTLDFTIAPNPASNSLFINNLAIENSNYSYSIFSMEGKIIVNDKLENEINIENLTNGVYLLRLQDAQSGSIGVKKFVVLK